jgi:hypothetical protein
MMVEASSFFLHAEKISCDRKTKIKPRSNDFAQSDQNYGHIMQPTNKGTRRSWFFFFRLFHFLILVFKQTQANTMDPFTDPKDRIGLLDRADRFENTDGNDSEDIFYDSQEFFDECRHYYDQAETEIEEKDKTSSDNTAKKATADNSSLQPSPADSILSQKRKLDFSDESASPQALEADITKKKVKFGGTSTLSTTNNLQSTFCNSKMVPSSVFFARKNLSSFVSVSANNNTSFASLLSEKRKHDSTTEQDESSVSRMQKKSESI